MLEQKLCSVHNRRFFQNYLKVCVYLATETFKKKLSTDTGDTSRAHIE